MLYSEWFKIKHILEKSKNILECRQKEIWFCHLGKNIGTEQNGKEREFLRPCLIIKKFNAVSILIIPLTSTLKTGKYYHKIIVNNSYSSVILSQLRFISVKRLKYRMGRIDQSEFIRIKRKIKKKVL